MPKAGVAADEEMRLEALLSLNILDTPPEERFDRLTKLAHDLFGTALSIISVIDEKRQWYKSAQGTTAKEVPREWSFCGHVILQDDFVLVPDAQLDDRFVDNPHVTNSPSVRFYAGYPLRTPGGHKVGTFCVVDFRPRTLSEKELEILATIASLAEAELNTHTVVELQKSLLSAKRQMDDFFSLSTDLLAIADASGKCLRANDAWHANLGYETDHLVGSSLFELVEFTERFAVTEALKKLASTDQKSVQFENRCVCADGTYRWLTWGASWDAERQLLYLVARDNSKKREILEALESERQRAERLLLSVMPRSIAERLKKGESQIADAVSEASILFVDLVGFTALAARLSPQEMVSTLSSIYSLFDAICEKHQVEKIKTIGDAYLCVCGIPQFKADHALRLMKAACEILEAVDLYGRQNPSLQLSVRIGINSGPLIAGVIGNKRFTYDVWGDSVNVASRLESLAHPGTILVGAPTYEKLKDVYEFTDRGEIEVKGRGLMQVYQYPR